MQKAQPLIAVFIGATLLAIPCRLLAASPASTPPAPAAASKPAVTPAAPAAPAPDAAWLAKAKADYPLKTCVVSGDALGGDMGEAIDYVYKQAGKPDRLVRFCCDECPPKFEKEPAKYLKLIDDAAAAKGKAKAKDNATGKAMDSSMPMP